MIKNFAVRLIRKSKNGKPHDFKEDDLVNQICFVEGYDYCRNKIDEMVVAFKEMPLPSDIMIEMKHNWSGELPKGSPLHVEAALKKEGYERPAASNTMDWFRLVEDRHATNGEKKVPRRFMIIGPDDISSLKYMLWTETKERSVTWTQSEERHKVIETGQPYGHSRPFNKEWWM